MSSQPAAHPADDHEMLAAAAYLSRVAEPASVPLWMLVERIGYQAAADAVRRQLLDPEVAACTVARHDGVDVKADLDAAHRNGVRLLTPASREWPHFAFAPLYAAARRRSAEWEGGYRRRPDRGELIPPLALWVRGPADLSMVGTRSVAVVGSRASTPYGDHVAADWCYRLAAEGVVVVSGGAYGIDAAAHRGALAADGECVLVSAGGLDRPYPSGNAALFESVARRGLLVSERPPGSAPHRQRFLSRNRLIAALGSATLVVEAAARSGALNSAGYARDLGRPVLAVPGPVTSALSLGCHRLLRREDDPARLVGRVEDVLEYCAPSVLPTPGGLGSEPQLFDPLDSLSHGERCVLDGFPARTWVTEAELSRLSGQPIQVVIGALGPLSELGLISSARQGYRLAEPSARPVM
jgi:DNA processing protein